MSEEPQGRPQPVAVLRGLSARRERWRAEREARLSLFSRQTLAADRLLVVARVRLGARRMTWLLGLLLAFHLLWRLSGLGSEHGISIGLDWLLGPALGLLRKVAPDEPLHDPLSLVLLHGELLLCVIGLELAGVWLLRAWLYQRLPMLISASRLSAQEQGPIALEEAPPDSAPTSPSSRPVQPPGQKGTSRPRSNDSGPDSADSGRAGHGRSPRKQHRRSPL